ncbi:MAG: hypothetical protein Tp156MES38741_30 [Prokaryotic dsDNA virus sp.]|mgnify:CR=1 FL=1|nr:MAG: hypothetical protein Tp156MES38741_30 [Prokaryotic dsDNA virus sp.]|tara:strand:+ start:2006 stop:2182 length:177 start_codon:yes stop_codon:yes gene_type:complete
MSGWQILGALIVALPFVAITVGMIRLMGFRETAVIWGSTLACLAIISVGGLLFSGVLP